MNPLNLLQKLHDFDRTSPQFHEQLIHFLRGNEYQLNVVPNLQAENLAWLVEYLDSVSPQTTSPRSVLNARVGPLRYLRSKKWPIPGITVQPQRDMWRQGGAPEIVHAFGFYPGTRAQRDV